MTNSNAVQYSASLQKERYALSAEHTSHLVIMVRNQLWCRKRRRRRRDLMAALRLEVPEEHLLLNNLRSEKSLLPDCASEENFVSSGGKIVSHSCLTQITGNPLSFQYPDFGGTPSYSRHQT
jgi:hypothetical protein